MSLNLSDRVSETGFFFFNHIGVVFPAACGGAVYLRKSRAPRLPDQDMFVPEINLPRCSGKSIVAARRIPIRKGNSCGKED